MLTREVRAGTAFRVRGRDNTVEFLLDEAVPFADLERELGQHLTGAGSRFAGMGVYANVGRRLLDTVEIERLRKLFDDHHVSLVELWCDREALEQALTESLSLPVAIGAHKARSARPSGRSDTLVVRHTCRTGTAIRHPGDVVVLGNVNPGAEVIAGGDVVVMGALWGLVHAGAGGDEEATIVAMSIRASQLRIAGRIAVGPAQGPQAAQLPNLEVACVTEGAITVGPYHGAREGSRPRAGAGKEAEL